jgi:serine/threonine protein phosphatase PrpC
MSQAESATQIGHRALTVKAFGVTDKGRVRPSNEDQFLSAELTKAMRIWQTSLSEPKAQFGVERGHLFLVADGMGGHRAGELASALAVIAVEQFTLNTFKWFFDSHEPEAQRVLTQFQTALRQADARILEESTEHPELRGMGTTLTMAFQLDAQLCVVHVGDSRAYLYGDDELYQLTHDDTLMAEMVRRGARFSRSKSPSTASATSSPTSSEGMKQWSTSRLTRSRFMPAIACCSAPTD